MSTTEQVIEMINQHRTENRVEFHRLSDALIELSRATTLMATATARVEERHARHDDAMHVVSNRVEDHEVRLRLLEKLVVGASASVVGGWKALTAAASVGAFLIYTLMNFLPQ